MRNRQPWIYIMMIVALIGMSLFLVQGPAQAATITCSTGMANNNLNDNDADGFSDWQECNWNGQALNASIFASNNKIYGYLKCPKTCPTGTTCHCLDPNKKDLFVIIVKASSGSLFPSNTDLLQYVSAATPQGGLGIAVHPIYPTLAPLTRTVVTGVSQNAAMITESLDTTSTDVLGFSNTGTPNGLDKTTIYTARIKAFINNVCGSYYGNPQCADTTGATGDALVKNYILHTIAHEVGHVLGPLAPTYDSNYGGYHYKSGTNVIMDQSIYYTQSTTNNVTTTTFYIGKSYTGSDQSSAKLK